MRALRTMFVLMPPGCIVVTDTGAPLDLELHAQGVGEAAHGELGRVVGGLRRHADEPEHAGEVDDVALTRRLEVGQEGLGAVDHAPEVDVHQPLEVLVGHGLDGRPEGDAGVVHDQVHLAVIGHHLVGPGVDGGPVGHVDPLAT